MQSGAPDVSVPVLSNTTVSTCASRSSAVECLISMPLRNNRPEAAVVNISSLAGLVGLPYGSVYCATKWGLRGLSQALRRELIDTAVRVICVYPDFVETESVTSDIKSHIARLGLMGRGMISADDAADMIVRGLRAGRSEIVVAPGPNRAMVLLDRLFPSLLDRMRPILRKPLDRRDRTADRGACRELAGPCCNAIHVHCAGAALADSAAKLGASHAD